jgi:hypothetical protein
MADKLIGDLPSQTATAERCFKLAEKKAGSIVSTFWSQYSVASRSVVEAATPMGALTVAKGVDWRRKDSCQR